MFGTNSCILLGHDLLQGNGSVLALSRYSERELPLVGSWPGWKNSGIGCLWDSDHCEILVIILI